MVDEIILSGVEAALVPEHGVDFHAKPAEKVLDEQDECGTLLAVDGIPCGEMLPQRRSRRRSARGDCTHYMSDNVQQWDIDRGCGSAGRHDAVSHLQ